MDCERMRANELLAANMIRQMLTVVTSVRANCIALWIRVGFDCYRVKERKTEWEREERGKKIENRSDSIGAHPSRCHSNWHCIQTTPGNLIPFKIYSVIVWCVQENRSSISISFGQKNRNMENACKLHDKVRELSVEHVSRAINISISVFHFIPRSFILSSSSTIRIRMDILTVSDGRSI